jgi:predicted CXXCH cytochrome family protein
LKYFIRRIEMKKVLFIAASILLVASVAFAQQSIYTYQAPSNTADGLLGNHDIKDGTTFLGCLGCHHPHNGNTGLSASGGAAQANGNLALFRWDLSGTSYDVYTEGDTTQFAALAKPADAGAVEMQSYVCLGCHDGNVTGGNSFAASNLTGADGVTKAPSITGSTSSLAGSHPVNYIFTAGGDMVTALNTDGTVGTGNLPLYLNAALANAPTVQCTTCHDQHKSTNVPFLRMANVNNVELCRNCHAGI